MYGGWLMGGLIGLSAGEVALDYLRQVEPVARARTAWEGLLYVLGFSFLKAVGILPLSFLFLYGRDLVARQHVTRYLEISLHIVLVGAWFVRVLLLPPFWDPLQDPLRFLIKALLSLWFVTADLSFFYLNVYWWIPRYLIPRKYGSYLVGLLGWLGLTAGLEYALYHLPIYTTAQTIALLKGVPGDAAGKGFILLLSFFYKFTKDWFRHERWQQQRQTQQLAAELDQLKMQVHPHFLFNTLNTIYALALQEKSPRTVDSIAKLSSMMRYMLEDCQQQWVTLEQELTYLNHFVQLQQLRMAPELNANIAYSVQGEVRGWLIAPMLLIPFVENAFKHGISIRDPCFITIQIRMEQDHLHLTVRNTWHAAKAAPQRVGLGLGNVGQLLNLLYPGRHRLSHGQTNDVYSTNLQLQLQPVAGQPNGDPPSLNF